MKINIPLLILIILTLSFSSCAKKEESTTAAAAAGVCTTCDPLTSTTTADGSITVGSVELSGKYATSCFTNVSTLIDDDDAPSDAKSYGFLFIVRGNDNATQETNYYTDSTCTTKGYTKKNVFDNVTVGSASGSNHQVAVNLTKVKFLVTTTVAETWAEAEKCSSCDLIVNTEYIMNISAAVQKEYNQWNVSAKTFEMGSANIDNYDDTELNGVKYTKQ